MVRFMLTVLLIPVGVLCVVGVVLLIMSPGRPSPVVEADGRTVVGSISEKIRVPTIFPRVEIPVYLLHGIHDYTVTLPETKAYFEALQAPVKGFYTFRGSVVSSDALLVPSFSPGQRIVSSLRLT